MPRHPGSRFAALALAVALVVTACSFGGSDDPEELRVFGPWRGADAEALRNVLSGFTDATGIDVRYTGSSSFPVRIRDRVTEGDLPDVAMFPQIGLLRQLVTEGAVKSLPDGVRREIEAGYDDAIAGFAGAQDIEGVLAKVSVKSLVWYRPDVFDEYGYVIPSTWDELITLTERITSDGISPWCMGIAAFDATGWAATDWVEDVLLRSSGPGVYDQWVSGEIPFTDPRIGRAIDAFGSLVLETGEPIGGRAGVINTSPQRAQDPAFEDPPRCVLYRQASFHRSDLPPNIDIGPDGDVDVFVLPSNDGDHPPLLIGGDVAAAMTDRPETWALMSFLASEEAARIWIAQGATTSPNRFVEPEDYPTEFDRRMASLIDSAAVVRFDASDLMPPSVGVDSFFSSMVTYVATSDVAAAQSIAQAGWPEP